MPYIRNHVDSHIILNVERIDLNQNINNGGFESNLFDNQLHGIIAQGFEHLKDLNHINLCKYTNVLRIDGNTYLFVSEGYSLTLDSIFGSSKEQLLKLDFTNIVNQIICGLQYLHSSGFAHGRLSLDCVSVSDDGCVKIGGYAINYVNNIVNYMCNNTSKGASKVLNDNRFRRNYFMNPFSLSGTDEFIDCLKNSIFLTNLMFYMPPEVIFFNSVLEKNPLFWFNVDIWSLGICILLIMSYIIETNQFSLASGSLHSIDQCSKTRPYFQILKKFFNLEARENKWVVDSFLFVLYLVVLINNSESHSHLSTIGLDVHKIIKTKFKFLSDEDECDDLKLINRLFENVAYNRFSFNDASDGTDKQLIDGKLNCSEKLFSYEDAISVSIQLLSAGDVLRNLIVLNHQTDDSSSEYQSFVNSLNYLLSLANDCLIVDSTKRSSILDICAQHSVLKVSEKALNYEDETSYSWFTYKEKMDYVNQEDLFSQQYSIESITESQTNLSESKFFLNYVSLENVLYYWTLLGNEVCNIIPFKFMRRVFSDDHKSEEEHHSHTITEYFKRYKVGRIFLSELITHVKLANLFPMIIEHQLRPSCVYARQQCFIYQLLRIRRFRRLLSNPAENRRQVFVEAMIDVPPLLRGQIWCNLLEILYRVGTKECPITTEYEFKPIPPELEQNLNFYNNDLLYSTTNLNKLLTSVNNLKMKIIHQQLPSSIYSFSIPLMLLYHNSSVYNTVLEKIFCKYLMDFYAPTGSFVNNYLSEFGTILNFFDPEISYHLRSIGAYADSYALPWFMSLFAENTSVNQLYLIWDSILVQPKQYIKFLAVMIIHNVRERLLAITDARIAISFISCIIDSLNVPMLMYLTTHMYNTWSEVLNPKGSLNKSSPLNEWLDQNDSFISSNDGESFNLDKNTFIFISDEYPFERCFKLSMETFSNVFKDCIIVDLRSLESYNMGHIPNSIHINKLVSMLSETDKKTNPLSIPIFNEKTTFNSNMDFKANAVITQTFSTINALRTNTKSAWLHENRVESNKIVLVAGDGYDEENEMYYLKRLLFEFKIQHVCYYRINSEEWPKVLTLSKI